MNSPLPDLSARKHRQGKIELREDEAPATTLRQAALFAEEALTPSPEVIPQPTSQRRLQNHHCRQLRYRRWTPLA